MYAKREEAKGYTLKCAPVSVGVGLALALITASDAAVLENDECATAAFKSYGFVETTEGFLQLNFEMSPAKPQFTGTITIEYAYSYTCQNGQHFGELLERNQSLINVDVKEGLVVGAGRYIQDTALPWYGCSLRQDFSGIDSVTVKKISCYPSVERHSVDPRPGSPERQI